MRRSLLGSALVAAVALVLAGCAGTPPAPTPTEAATPTPPPTPTPTVLVIGPADKPPVVFGGDCAVALTAEEIAATTGLSVEAPTSESGGTVANVGGLNCRYGGDAGTVQLQILPMAGLGDAEFPPDQLEYYFETCDPDWVCAAISESPELWIAASFQFAPTMTRESVDAWGAAIGAQIGAAFSRAPSEPWERDMTGWWPVLDCAAVTEELAGGEPGITGQVAGYIDPPMPGFVMADAASHQSHCVLSEREAPFLDLYTSAGIAWQFEGGEGFAPVDGVPEIQYKIEGDRGPYGGVPYVLTDGVNVMWAEIEATATSTVEEIAHSLAELAAGLD